MSAIKQKPAPAAPLLVSEREAARLLGCCGRTVFALRQEGKLPHIKLRGAVRYAVSDLEQFVQGQRVLAN